MPMRIPVWFYCLSVVLPSAGSIHAQDKNRWEEFRSFDGRFRVTAPGNFRLKTDSIATDIGTLAWHTYFFENAGSEAENVVYMVSYVDYPEGSVHHDSTELVQALFEAGVEESAFSVAGRVSWTTKVKLGQYPGIFWRVDYKDGRAVIKTKAFFVQNRYYAVQAVMRRERSLNTAADKFLDSFRLFE